MWSLFLCEMIDIIAVECNTLIKVGTRSVSQQSDLLFYPRAFLPFFLFFALAATAERPVYIGERERQTVCLSLCHTAGTIHVPYVSALLKSHNKRSSNGRR